jgi:hypothetical protein
MDIPKDPVKEGMDMDHSKDEKRTMKQSKWICQESARKEWKWIILRWKDENGRCKEEVVIVDSQGRNENGGNGSVFRIQL